MDRQPKNREEKKKGVGRPPSPPSTIVRVRVETVAAIDAWTATQRDVPDRVEAISRLIARGLLRA